MWLQPGGPQPVNVKCMFGPRHGLKLFDEGNSVKPVHQDSASRRTALVDQAKKDLTGLEC